MKINTISNSSFGILMPPAYVNKVPDIAPAIVQRVQKSGETFVLSNVLKNTKQTLKPLFSLKTNNTDNFFRHEAIVTDTKVRVVKKAKDISYTDDDNYVKPLFHQLYLKKQLRIPKFISKANNNKQSRVAKSFQDVTISQPAKREIISTPRIKSRESLSRSYMLAKGK